MNVNYFFSTGIYIEDRPDFLSVAKEVTERRLKDAQKQLNNQTEFINPYYPIQTDGLYNEPSLKEFIQYIVQSAWNILDEQGYALEQYGTYLREIWAQEHRQHQGHDEHVHHFGDQISGVYLLEYPENGSMLTIHDPRPGKKQIHLTEKDATQVTLASLSASLIPKPGRFYFYNSWLPHSITRNLSKTSTKLIHFNLGLGPLPPANNSENNQNNANGPIIV